MAVRKKFNPALYKAFDGPAREALASYLVSKGHTIVNNEENYGVDVVSQKDGYTYFNEAEVKTQWDGDWPAHWSEIRIPERKQRLLHNHDQEKGVLNFYVFRSDLKQAWRIKDTLLHVGSLKEVKGRNIRSGEMFFHIPYHKAQLVEID